MHVDVRLHPAECVFDILMNVSLDQGNLVKVFGWYDNEMGYSSRVADLVKRIG